MEVLFRPTTWKALGSKRTSTIQGNVDCQNDETARSKRAVVWKCVCVCGVTKSMDVKKIVQEQAGLKIDRV